MGFSVGNVAGWCDENMSQSYISTSCASLENVESQGALLWLSVLISTRSDKQRPIGSQSAQRLGSPIAVSGVSELPATQDGRLALHLLPSMQPPANTDQPNGE